MARPVRGGVLAGGVAAGALGVCGAPARACQHPLGGARPGRHRRHRHVAHPGAVTVEADICRHVSLQCARVAASCGAGTACHTLARHVYSLVWAWADITLWKGGAAARVTCHVSPCAGLWDGYDHYAGWGVAQSGATLGAGLLLLSATRTVRSAFGAPVHSLDSIYSL